MKKYTFFIVLICILLKMTYLALSQDYCMTESNYEDFLKSNKSSSILNYSDHYSIRIFIHIVRRDDGSGGQTQEEVNTALSILVSDYEQHNICFSLFDINEIKNSNLYNLQPPFNGFFDSDSDGKFDNLESYCNSNVIDIFLFANDKLNYGKASGIPGTSLVLGGVYEDQYQNSINLVTSHIISHEMGHCLGLFHTFHGLCESGCRELVDGSNCDICGDYVCDTPPDPQTFQYNEDCSWNGNTCGVPNEDENGDPYNPDMNLIMMYSLPTCMTEFTNGQENRMLDHLETSTLLSNVIVPNDVFLSNILINNGEFILYHSIVNIISQDNIIIETGGDMIYRAGSSITINEEFHAKSGSEFLAYIVDSCSSLYQEPFNSAKIAELNYNNQQINKSDVKLNINPNPVTNVVHIEYTLNKKTELAIELFNVFGEKVSTMTKFNNKKPGQYTLDFNICNFSSGVYFVVFKTNYEITTKQIVFLK